jgi:hypothetical protein
MCEFGRDTQRPGIKRLRMASLSTRIGSAGAVKADGDWRA